jgi:indole-3-glycerol phosphate synthase
MTLASDSDFLLRMAKSSRQRDAVSRAQLSDAQQRSQLVCLTQPAGLQVPTSGFDLIAEIKKRSPAEGKLDKSLGSVEEQAATYVSGGAAALSVLTEPDQFSGSLADLEAAVGAADTTPVMRKDFLVSRYQVREARLAGASGVLLIAAMLTTDQLKAMLEAALEQDMFVLMEAFDPADLDKCLPVLEEFGPAIKDGRCDYLLGINCRDLRTLKVNFNHFEYMTGYMPSDLPWVAESGVTTTEQIETVARLGYRMALVGTALMRTENPAETVSNWAAAGAAACS